jgi:CubicO group peptidase (beta-lactamase class C family)
MTRFYQLLLDGGTFGGKRVFEPRTVRRARNESAYFEVDHTLVLPVRYGLGFMLGGRHVSLFGADTEFAFGHLGFTNTYTWADPARDISVALLTTGKTFVPYELWVQREILSAIAEHCPRVR